MKRFETCECRPGRQSLSNTPNSEDLPECTLRQLAMLGACHTTSDTPIQHNHASYRSQTSHGLNSYKRQQTGKRPLTFPWHVATGLLIIWVTCCVHGTDNCKEQRNKSMFIVCWLSRQTELYFQSVPRSKHTASVIQTSQLMLYREIMAVCSQIHTKHINTLCGQNVELLDVKLAVHIVTTVGTYIDHWALSVIIK